MLALITVLSRRDVTTSLNFIEALDARQRKIINFLVRDEKTEFSMEMRGYADRQYQRNSVHECECRTF